MNRLGDSLGVHLYDGDRLWAKDYKLENRLFAALHTWNGTPLLPVPPTIFNTHTCLMNVKDGFYQCVK